MLGYVRRNSVQNGAQEENAMRSNSLFSPLWWTHTPKWEHASIHHFGKGFEWKKHTLKTTFYLFADMNHRRSSPSLSRLGLFVFFFVGPLIHLPSHDDVIIGQWQAAVSNRRPPKGADSPMGNRATHWPQRCHFGHCSSNSFRREYLRRHRRRQRRYWRDCEFFLCEIPPNQDVHLFAKIKQTNQKKKQTKNKRTWSQTAGAGSWRTAPRPSASRLRCAEKRRSSFFSSSDSDEQ